MLYYVVCTLYLVSALKPAHCVNELIAGMFLGRYVGFGVQAEPV